MTVYNLTVLLGTLGKLRKGLLALLCPSVRMSAWNNSSSAGRIFMKFYIRVCVYLSVCGCVHACAGGSACMFSSVHVREIV
jgi:hypothetical protein